MLSDWIDPARSLRLLMPRGTCSGRIGDIVDHLEDVRTDDKAVARAIRCVCTVCARENHGVIQSEKVGPARIGNVELDKLEMPGGGQPAGKSAHQCDEDERREF